MRFAAAIGLALIGAAAGAEPAAFALAGADGGRIVLLGSVHYLRESDYPLPSRVESLYREADRIIMEIDLDDLDPALLQRSFMQAATLPPDLRLENVLSDEVYERAVSVAESMQIDLGLMSRLEPWLVANTLLDIGMVRSGFAPDRGLEQHLVGRARADGIPVDGLETAEDQIAIFDSLDLPAQEAMLAQTLDEIETAAAALGEMIDAWRAGDLDDLADSLMDDFDEFPGLYDRLVVDRNRNWTDQLRNLETGGATVLVVVGALHLIGSDSVVEMLREAGLAVEPVRATNLGAE